MDLDPERIARSPFVAGALGAMVALKGAPGNSWLERVVNVFSGCLLAGYFTPALMDWLHITSPALQGGAAFALGLFGMNLVAAITDGIRAAKFGEALQSWITRR